MVTADVIVNDGGHTGVVCLCPSARHPLASEMFECCNAIQSTGVCQLLVTPIDHWSLCFYNEMSDVQVKTNVCFSLVCCRHVLKSINFIPREYAPRRAGRPYVYTYVRARKKSDITSFDVTARVNN